MRQCAPYAVDAEAVAEHGELRRGSCINDCRSSQPISQLRWDMRQRGTSRLPKSTRTPWLACRSSCRYYLAVVGMVQFWTYQLSFPPLGSRLRRSWLMQTDQTPIGRRDVPRDLRNSLALVSHSVEMGRSHPRARRTLCRQTGNRHRKAATPRPFG
jgi:hypothetical protein